jgi:hypothetical protein
VRSIALGGSNVYVGGALREPGRTDAGRLRRDLGIQRIGGCRLAERFPPGAGVRDPARDSAGRTVIGGRFVAMGDWPRCDRNIAR